MIKQTSGKIIISVDVIVLGSNISGLYFQLNGKIYLPGEFINGLDIGLQKRDRSDPGSTLICMTENINTPCCRSRDGANVGNWYYPNGAKVLRQQEGYSPHYYRIGYSNQVRLMTFHDTVNPSGNYTCSVPDQQGFVWNSSIFIYGILFKDIVFLF